MLSTHWINIFWRLTIKIRSLLFCVFCRIIMQSMFVTSLSFPFSFLHPSSSSAQSWSPVFILPHGQLLPDFPPCLSTAAAPVQYQPFPSCALFSERHLAELSLPRLLLLCILAVRISCHGAPVLVPGGKLDTGTLCSHCILYEQ